MPKAVTYAGGSAYSNNQGSTPAFPATGVPVLNTFGRTMVVDVDVTDGELVSVSVGGNTKSTAGLYAVPPNWAIVLNYTGSPSWTWTDGSGLGYE